MLGEDGQKMSKSKRNYREPRRDLRPLRGRRPAVVLLRQPAAVDLDPLQRAGDQGDDPRVPAAAVERLQLLRHLREHRRLRSGRGDCRAAAGQLTPDVLARAAGYRPPRRAERAGPLDPQRTEPHGGGRGRADGRLRQLRRLRAADRVRRRPEQLVRPPQPRPLLERRGTRPTSATPIGRFTSACLTTAKLIAPFVPFLAEAMWQNLAVAAFRGRPRGRAARRERPPLRLSDRRCGRGRRGLSARMGLVREIVSLGRSARMARQAQGPPAAGPGRGRAGRPHAPGMAGRACRADLRRAERQAGRFHRAGRPVHHLHGPARPEAAGPAAGQAPAGAAESCWPRPTAAGCWPSWRAKAT